MPSPILARADALMQRRRQHSESDDLPVLTDAINADDDIPVLLDSETDSATDQNKDLETAAPRNETPPNLLLDSGVRDILAHELARRVEQRITAELPRIIESTVRDFLAEQEMIAALQPRD